MGIITLPLTWSISWILIALQSAVIFFFVVGDLKTNISLSNLPPAYGIVEGQLVVSVQVSQMDDGIIIPRNQRANRVFIELGANTIYNAKQTFMTKPEMRDVFIVAAEPLLDKYISNLELSKNWAQNSMLGEYIPHGRGIILPVAIGPKEGLSRFTVGAVSGCSSMLPFKNISHFCSKIHEIRMVPTISLRTLLTWMGNPNVEFAKIDIQGMDYFAIESAGDKIRLLRRVQFEVPLKQQINTGVYNCHEILRRMNALGFRLGTGDQARPYAPLEGAYGSPLIYDGGPVNCSSESYAEADVFMVRL